MDRNSTFQLGKIGWVDLTVDNANQVRDFYRSVAGWSFEPVDMGGYADYEMRTNDGQSVAGICHRRGPNANLPPTWLVYITVEDISASLQSVVELGGKVLDERKDGDGNVVYCVIQDPAGAVAALARPM